MRGKTRAPGEWYRVFLFMLVLAVMACCTAASADDAEQLKYLPGQWVYSGEVEKEGEDPQEVDLILTLEESGEMSLRFTGRNGEYDYSCAGTWTSEFVPDAQDRLTLLFTSTDNPLHAGDEYNAKCEYAFYTESWVENDTWNIYLITQENTSGSVSPFLELYGYDDLALHREEKPNMRVVKCKDYVSLRSGPSKSSKRLARIPLGASVLALPKAGEVNGFVWCTYHDEYGYILSEYLEPAE